MLCWFKQCLQELGILCLSKKETLELSQHFYLGLGSVAGEGHWSWDPEGSPPKVLVPLVLAVDPLHSGQLWRYLETHLTVSGDREHTLQSPLACGQTCLCFPSDQGHKLTAGEYYSATKEQSHWEALGANSGSRWARMYSLGWASLSILVKPGFGTDHPEIPSLSNMQGHG